MSSTSELDLEQMQAAAGEATTLLQVLAHRDRLMLLCVLSQDEMCVSELEECLGIRQPSLSQHLGVLRRRQLVSTRRQGTHIYYRISDARAATLLETLYQLFCEDRGDST